MDKNQTILWFPLVRYLSLQPFEDMLKVWSQNHRHILVDTSAYSAKFQAVTPSERGDLLNIYDEVYVLEPLRSTYSPQSHINEYLKYKELKERIREILTKENIELAVFPTDFSYEFRVLRKLHPKIKLAVLQVSFKRIDKLKSYGMAHRIKALFYDKVLGVPLFRRRYHFGEQDPKAWYLFWTEKWAKSVLRPGTTRFRFSNSTLATNSERPDLKLDEVLINKIGGRPLVTVFLNKRLSIGEESFKEYADFYMNMVNCCPNLFFVIKVHPYEDIEYCYQLYSEMNPLNSVIIAADYKPEQLLVNSRLFVTQWSTAIQDAMRYKVPTILVNPNDRNSMRKWFVDDFPFIINEKDQLPIAVGHALNQPDGYWTKVAPFIEDSFGPSFENGPEKMLDQLYEILKFKTKPTFSVGN